ncbi:MAG: histone deacetylase [Candidatus Lokiarchaeota archaeon]|nr:histone deacetylase [Candidatus Lokiarchaeota archaeon]
MPDKKVGIILDIDFGFKHIPPFSKPSFMSYEHPFRINCVFNHLERTGIFNDDRVVKIKPKEINEDILALAHSKYHIDSIKKISNIGGGLLDEEVFVTEDTFELAKKAVGGAIEAIEGVVKNRITQSFALIRPPGHHALRDKSSGLCIFNNIANSILYLRKQLKFNQKIAIIDIDDHFGDGLAQFFYDDPSILYFSIHEFDFTEGNLGMIDELGIDEGLGKNINFPVPDGMTNEDFYYCLEMLDPILNEFQPALIVVAAGFDMYFADPIGNCSLTSIAYNQFAEKLLKIAEKVCEGRISFILEGGYDVIGLPYCVEAVLKALLNEKYEAPAFENNALMLAESNIEDLKKIKNMLTKLLSPYWEHL